MKVRIAITRRLAHWRANTRTRAHVHAYIHTQSNTQQSAQKHRQEVDMCEYTYIPRRFYFLFLSPLIFLLNVFWFFLSLYEQTPRRWNHSTVPGQADLYNGLESVLKALKENPVRLTFFFSFFPMHDYSPFRCMTTHTLTLSNGANVLLDTAI